MHTFPRQKDIDNEQFMVCGYCHEHIYFYGELTNISNHIRNRHYRRLACKSIFKETIEIRNQLKNDSNICWVTQMVDGFPDIFIYVYNYENFMQRHRKLKSSCKYHVFQKSTKVTDFIWPVIKAFNIAEIDKIHISDFCSGEPLCRHFGILLHVYGKGWFQVPVMMARFLILFYHLMNTEQKQHFYNFKTVHEMINN
jgi:hypothetical protein